MNAKCCICSTVRNSGKYIKKVLQNMELIGSIFSEYKIIISYDKSDDDTLDIIRKYQAEKEEECLILHINQDKLHEYRVYNIAKARNQCLSIMREKCETYEYFIMMDSDDVCYEAPKINTLEYYLLQENVEQWDALSFNKDPYYDLWALSKYPYSYGCMHFRDWKSWGVFIEKIIKETPPKTLIPCLSAFNGFSIYKTDKFIDCIYDGKPRFDLLPKHLLPINESISGPIFLKGKAGLIDCEHRSFHLSAINKHNAKIRIAPEILFS